MTQERSAPTSGQSLCVVLHEWIKYTSYELPRMHRVECIGRRQWQRLSDDRVGGERGRDLWVKVHGEMLAEGLVRRMSMSESTTRYL